MLAQETIARGLGATTAYALKCHQREEIQLWLLQFPTVITGQMLPKDVPVRLIDDLMSRMFSLIWVDGQALTTAFTKRPDLFIEFVQALVEGIDHASAIYD